MRADRLPWCAMLTCHMHVHWIAGVLFLCTSGLAGGDVGMKPGDVFPDYFLPSLETGKIEHLSSFRGQKTLLLIYASW